MRQFLLAGVLLLLCGCFRGIDKLNTLEEYSQTFDSRVKISLSNKKSITLSEARAMALANNPTLHAAASAIRAAQYSYYRSLSAWSPEISVTGTVQNANSRGYNLHHPPAGISQKFRISPVKQVNISFADVILCQNHRADNIHPYPLIIIYCRPRI